MTPLGTRFLLFLFGCIGTRSLFTLFAKTSKPEYLPYFGWVALVPAIGFFLIYFTGSRRTGAEVFGDRIWWNNLRPIHGMLWLLFGIMGIQRNQNSWWVLLLDTVLGLVSFLIFHWRNGDFGKLLM